MPLSYDNIATTTLQLIRPRLADTIFKANAVSAWLLMKGRVKMESGGKWIEEPLIYQKNDTVQSYRGYDILNTAPTEELTMAKYNWRQAATAISISGLEELENAGEQAVFNLLSTKTEIAEMSMTEWLNEKLLTATANKDLSRDFLGFDEIVENVAGGSQGTLGGIDRATYSWWQNQFTSSVDLTSASGTNRLMTRAMITMANNVSKGKAQPDLIVTTQALYEWFEKENHDLLRLRETETLNIGFPNQRFKNITMVWDEHVQTGLMYFITSRFMGITLHGRRNFVMSPFVRPYNQDSRVAQILLAGNMTCNNSRHQGVIVFANTPS
jgi:hypothetical protein